MSLSALKNQKAYDQAAYRQLYDQYKQCMTAYMWGPDIDPGPPPVPEALYIAGPYRLERHSDEWFVLRDRSREKVRDVCAWPGKRLPAREAMAAAILHDRLSSPRRNARDEFGALLGVKLFSLTGDKRLQSPQQKTIWDGPVLTAHTWDESEAVRGKCGIHASWPPRSWQREPRVDSINDPSHCVAVVRGLGKFVAGEDGWRAEKVIIDRVFLPQTIWSLWRTVRRLRKLYPEVSFEEEPWTLERSLKSAPSRPAKCL